MKYIPGVKIVCSIPMFSKGLNCGSVYILTHIQPTSTPSNQSLVKSEGLVYHFKSPQLNDHKEIEFNTIIQADKFIEKWKI
jgi:hypothetical protein